MAEDDKLIFEKASALFKSRIRAGAEYCKALVGLGLDPDIACWVYLSAEDRVELAIVTSMVDRIGPLPIYEELYRAYETSALPKEIDPFEVSLYSPHTRMAVDLLNTLLVSESGYLPVDLNNSPLHVLRAWFVIGISDPMIVQGAGVYRVKRIFRTAVEDRAQWRKFKGKVDAVAA